MLKISENPIPNGFYFYECYINILGWFQAILLAFLSLFPPPPKKKKNEDETVSILTNTQIEV